MSAYDSNGKNPMGRSQFGGRIMSALLIAIFGFIMYMSHSEINPVTGKKQHVSLTPNQEIKLGLESSHMMAHKMGGELPGTDARVQEVRKIGQYLVAHTDAYRSPWKFQFHVLADTNTINAFALPGGQIFITLGLLNHLQTEAQLAGVLSHEMGHVIERHTAQQMAKSQLGQLLVVAVATGASDQHHSMNSPAVIASMVNQMFQLHYSRQDESEADLWGLKLMTQADFNPLAMIEVMEILKATGAKSHAPEFFQTHPNPDLRIQQIQTYLRSHPPSANLKNGRKLKDALPESLTSHKALLPL